VHFPSSPRARIPGAIAADSVTFYGIFKELQLSTRLGSTGISGCWSPAYGLGCTT
jgi:hypothetical protein